MYEHSYDVFSGSVNSNPLWLEAVRGKESALLRMKERSEHTPGPYFVFDSMTHGVLAFVDTSSDAYRSR